MRKFNSIFLSICVQAFVLVTGVRAQAPRYLGTKTPYQPPGVDHTPPPAGYRPVFVNYVGRHGARYMTKAGPDLETLRLLEKAESVHGLTPLGQRVEGMVRHLCVIEKGQYENITLLGAQEQQAIGQRMLSRYSAAFTGRGMDVVVTWKVRTQQSADAFLQAFGGYKGGKHFTKAPDSTDAVLRFYDLSPAYQQYKKSAALKAAFDSLDKDRRTAAAAAAVGERVFTPGFRAGLSAAEEVLFAGNLYDLYSVRFSLSGEVKKMGLAVDSVDLGIAFGETELAWNDFVSGAQDFLEKGPGRDPLGIQVKVAAPLLEDFVKTTDRAVDAGAGGAGKDGGAAGGKDAVLRFTHAEAISPFASLLGIPAASVPSADIYAYAKHWKVGEIIPLSANVQWVVYSNGSSCLVKVLLNEREVLLPIDGKGAGIGSGGPYYRWEELRRYCMNRLRAVGANPEGNMLEYLKGLR